MIIGIGCDIVDISRIEKAMGKPFCDKLLTEAEKALSKEFPFARKCEWIAGRFAAKEAIYKAMHRVVNCSFWEIEVLNDEYGAPVCTCFPYDIQVSIAHEKDYAIAYALVQTKES